MRVAVYYAPAPFDPLWRAACSWLGRDPETAAMLQHPNVPDLPALTAEPRLYGFHATLKPPMRLTTAYDAFIEDAERLAATIPAFDLPPLAVADLSGFLALRETTPSPDLHALADACVTALDAHRAPPDAAELARRRKTGLPPAQDANLLRWGYPHVLDTWFFHMTLTRRLSPEERALVRPAAEAYFAPVLQLPRRVDALSIFTQAAPGAPFLVAERLPLAAS
jgi:putative phosphonate metabolism protein